MTRLSCSNSTHSPRGVFAALRVTFTLTVSSAFAAGTKPNAAKPAYGYIDTSGALVIEPQFDEAHLFANGRAAVNKGFGGGMYCIDRIGDRVFPWADDAYALPLRFHGALAHVTMKTRKGGWGTTGGPWLFRGEIPDASWRHVNRKGQQVWPPPVPQASGKHKQQSTREFVASTLGEYGDVPGTHVPRFIPTYDDTQLVDALAGYAAKAACLPPRPY